MEASCFWTSLPTYRSTSCHKSREINFEHSGNENLKPHTTDEYCNMNSLSEQMQSNAFIGVDWRNMVSIVIFTFYFMGLWNEMKCKHCRFVARSHRVLRYDFESSFTYFPYRIFLQTSDRRMFISINSSHTGRRILLRWLFTNFRKYWHVKSSHAKVNYKKHV
jgi:hypothetical protein